MCKHCSSRSNWTHFGNKISQNKDGMWPIKNELLCSRMLTRAIELCSCCQSVWIISFTKLYWICAESTLELKEGNWMFEIPCIEWGIVSWLGRTKWVSRIFKAEPVWINVEELVGTTAMRMRERILFLPNTTFFC